MVTFSVKPMPGSHIIYLALLVVLMTFHFWMSNFKSISIDHLSLSSKNSTTTLVMMPPDFLVTRLSACNMEFQN